MTYKGMLLSTLLIPIVTTSFGKSSNEQKIKLLEEKRFQKELEISDLGAKIAEKQQLLIDMRDKAHSDFENLCEYLSLKGKELEDFKEKSLVSDLHFMNVLYSTLNENGNVKGLLTEELFDEKIVFPDNFKPLIFLTLRGILESNLLDTLVERYETCLQELIEIDRELNVL